jgi:DNA-binding beta-propeller fold protein YncE
MTLEHPNVVPIYDAGDVDGRVYLAMRYVEGTDLRTLLRAEGALDPARALAICSQMAAALDAAHARGLVHRDVKPANVLLDPSDHVYLADFGLTRRLEEQGLRGGEGRSLGTPTYLAPEQIEDRPVDGRADVYSLGCLVYECLTGGPPFARGSRLAVAWAHLEEDPPNASERKSGLPEAIDPVIRKAMAKEPDDRYSTCAGLIAAVEQALGSRRPPIFRRPKFVLVAVAILLVLAALLTVVLITRDGGTAASGLVVRANTLVRIDPATNALSAVVPMDQRPLATAAGGHRVWVYSHDEGTVSEIDPATNTVRHTTWPTAQPEDIGESGGPILAADTGGAWIIGVDGNGNSVLTRILSGGRGTREYTLGQGPAGIAPGPAAVALGANAVWVLERGIGGRQVLRIDPVTGDVSESARFSTSSQIDALAVGEGAVWVVDSSRGTLYRIDSRTADVTGRRDLGDRATRPVVAFGSVWVRVTRFNADPQRQLVLVDPRTLDISEDYVPPESGDSTSGYGSMWWYDVPTGTVARYNRHTKDLASTIRVTDAPFSGGLCLTSIAAGAGGVWVAVGALLYPRERACR